MVIEKPDCPNLGKFQDLIRSVDKGKVMDCLVEIHKMDSKATPESTIRTYNPIFDRLLVLEARPTNFSILVSSSADNMIKDGEIPKPEDIGRADVSGFNVGDEHYQAIELTPWEEWLLADVYSYFNPEKTIAECLWEMTFYGYDENEVAEAATMLFGRYAIAESIIKLEECEAD
jgi:hypothetical protein